MADLANLLPMHCGDVHLFVPEARKKKERTRTLEARSVKASHDQEIVQEFRSKLKTVEDMVAKLGFNLREIQDLWSDKRTKSN